MTIQFKSTQYTGGKFNKKTLSSSLGIPYWQAFPSVCVCVCVCVCVFFSDAPQPKPTVRDPLVAKQLAKTRVLEPKPIFYLLLQF